MKKILSVLLSLIMVLGLFTVAYASEAEDVYSEYPVVLVPGFGSCVLYRVDEETGEKITVWSDIVGQIADGGSLEAIAPDFMTYLTKGEVEPLAQTLSDGFNRIFDGVKCNPDGSSYYDVKSYINTAQECNYANLKELYPEGDYQYELEIMTDLGEKVGLENLFVYTTDFRKGAIESAACLRDFIDDVIDYTNAQRKQEGKAPIDKVNLFAVSHGGQIAGTYLTLYGYEGKVNNAVLTIPALGGACLAYDAFSYQLEFDDMGLLSFIQHGMLLEEDLEIFVAADRLGFLDELTNAIAPKIMETIGLWQCLWDFIPLEYYEEIKEALLDEEINAGIIEKSDRMHYDIMSPDGDNYYAKGFKKAQAAGTNIYIMAGYDNQSVTGLKVSSDSILPVSGSTGAVAAPYGERFADGYTQKVDTGFYQVSPSMTVDASTCYLPEHTWLIENYYHGMTAKDEFTYSLMQKLLLTDESFNVHSMEEYPQFHATTNAAHTVFASFNNSTEGYVSSEDTALTIKNISAENCIFVSSLTVYGADFDFKFVPFILKPGESKDVEIKGEIPAVSRKNFEINIGYVISTVTPLGLRTFDFTVMNGEDAVYDENSPYVKADISPKVDELLSDEANEKLEFYGLKAYVATFYDVIYKLYAYIVNLIESFIK